MQVTAETQTDNVTEFSREQCPLRWVDGRWTRCNSPYQVLCVFDGDDYRKCVIYEIKLEED